MSSSKRFTRREFIKGSAAVGGMALLGAPRRMLPPFFLRNPKLASRVMILGIDGMDPVLLQRFMDEGIMPTFKKLTASGYLGKLATTLPPQSPVAWSSFITGCKPGGHGIYDFVHRDAAAFLPYLSTSRSFGSSSKFDIGKYSIPLKSGKVELMRRGTPFWSILEDHDIPAALFQLPANFPIQESAAIQTSGMGTPDLLGTYGTFTYYSETEVPNSSSFSGGRVVKVKAVDHVIKTSLAGPDNPFRSDGEHTRIDFAVYRDPWEPSARIVFQDQEIILKQGEWSEWIPIKFELVPLFAAVGGMVRMYLKEVHPHLKLYLSPINIDPMDPELPICSPGGYSRELSEAIGRFHTIGFPEDTKALSEGVFTSDEFLSQSKAVLEERLRGFEYEFNRFHEGFFFYYFSSIDQNTHMMWRAMDPSHPLYEESASAEVKEAVRYFYRRMDEVLAAMTNKADSRTIMMVLSDHGFAPFTREFHLSTWLVKNGFTAMTNPSKMTEGEFYKNVDWSRTKAYAMGLNGIYLNLEGREKRGSLKPDRAQKVKQEIIARLRQEVDPVNGQKVVVGVYDAADVYRGPYLGIAPDLVVGYQSGYRISDEAALGKFPAEVIGDRTNKWSADHCMDPSVVPGVLLTNKGLRTPQPGLWDLAPTIQKAFSIDPLREMDGQPIFSA